MTSTQRLICRATFGLAATLLCAANALAADAATDAQARYRQELAVCNSGQSNQDASTCRLEARNARAEARRNGLTNPAEHMQDNMLKRCTAHQGDDRRACEMRMGMQGTTEGSVAGGGILRQSTISVPTK